MALQQKWLELFSQSLHSEVLGAPGWHMPPTFCQVWLNISIGRSTLNIQQAWFKKCTPAGCIDSCLWANISPLSHKKAGMLSLMELFSDAASQAQSQLNHVMLHKCWQSKATLCLISHCLGAWGECDANHIHFATLCIIKEKRQKSEFTDLVSLGKLDKLKNCLWQNSWLCIPLCTIMSAYMWLDVLKASI